MTWFEHLRQYFPAEEMRAKAHFDWLGQHKQEVWRVYDTQEAILVLLEYDDACFIDYLYVKPEQRGKGVGGQVLRKLQQKGKPILLEVEPTDPADPDTRRRWRFYERAGFQHAPGLSIRLQSLVTLESTDLEILYWAPEPVTEAQLYGWMRQMYRDLYAELDPTVYGRAYPPVDEAIQWNRAAEAAR